jgi:hypothetical protein
VDRQAVQAVTLSLCGDIFTGTLWHRLARDRVSSQHIVYAAGKREFYTNTNQRLNSREKLGFSVDFEKRPVIIDGI